MFVIGSALCVLSYRIITGKSPSQAGGGEVSSGTVDSIRPFTIPAPKSFLAVAAAFWLWSLLSAVHAYDALHSFFGFYYRFSNGFLFYTLWVLFIFLLFFTWSKERFRFLMKILFFDAIVIAAVAIFQSTGIGYYDGLEPSGFLRAPSLLGNPNFSTMFIVSLLPAGFVWFTESKTIAQKIYYGIGCFCIIWAMVALSSRGAEVGFLAGLGSLTVLLIKFKKLSLRLGLFLGGALAIAALMWFGSRLIVRNNVFLATPLLTTEQPASSNIETRLFAWDIARQAIGTHPILGVGLGNFQIFFERNRGTQLVGSAGVFDDAHNIFLQLAATGGLPLALLFMAMVLWALWNTWNNSEGDILLGASAAGLVCWLVVASFTPVVIPCFVLLAVLLVGQVAGQGSFAARIPPFKKLLAWKLGLVGFALCASGVSFVVAEHIFYAGYKNFYSGNFAQSYKLASLALRFNPTNQLYYIYRAGSSVGLGKSQAKVMAEVGSAVDIHSHESRTFMSAANLYFMGFQHTGAPEYSEAVVQSMQQALSYDPLYAERYSKLGFYYYQFGKLDQAKEYVKTGLSLNSQQFSPWILLAKIYQMKGQREPMLFALQKAFKINPGNKQMQNIWHIAKTDTNISHVPLYIQFGQDKLE